MKYKAGDKVKIKTWKAMEKEFGLNGGLNDGCIAVLGTFTPRMEKELELIPNRVLTIEGINNDRYSMVGISWIWSDGMVEEPDILDPIENRFEILDLESK